VTQVIAHTPADDLRQSWALRALAKLPRVNDAQATTRRRWLSTCVWWAVSAPAALTLGACRSKPPAPLVIAPPPAPPKFQLDVVIEIGPGSNPDVRGRPSPVVVRVFELKAASAFLSADFLTLYDKEDATIAADRVSREEFVAQPKSSQAFKRELSPEVRFIGVMAAFRAMDRAQWRVAVPVQTGRSQTIRVLLDNAQLRVPGADT
jgi:type VI secretion system protein VasD